MRVTLPLLAAALPLAACQPLPAAQSSKELPPMENEDNPIDLSAGNCRPEPAQRFLGQRATAELGAAMLKATGATTLRWAPPGAALTMDYRMDRLTVAYGADMVVTRASCG